MHGQLGVLMHTPVLTAGGRKELHMVEEAASRAGTAITASLGRQVHRLEDVADSYRCARNGFANASSMLPASCYSLNPSGLPAITDEERRPMIRSADGTALLRRRCG